MSHSVPVDTPIAIDSPSPIPISLAAVAHHGTIAIDSSRSFAVQLDSLGSRIVDFAIFVLSPFEERRTKAIVTIGSLVEQAEMGASKVKLVFRGRSAVESKGRNSDELFGGFRRGGGFV